MSLLTSEVIGLGANPYDWRQRGFNFDNEAVDEVVEWRENDALDIRAIEMSSAEPFAAKHVLLTDEQGVVVFDHYFYGSKRIAFDYGLRVLPVPGSPLTLHFEIDASGTPGQTLLFTMSYLSSFKATDDP